MNNKEFWKELCGTNAFNHLGLKKIDKKSLGIFDRWYLDEMYPYLFKYLNIRNISKMRVLEIGLGFGTVGQYLFMKSKSYVGLDYSSNPVSVMKDRIRRKRKQLTASAIEGDARQLPFRVNSFDFVVSIGCLHHTGNIQKCVNEIYRVLDDNGQALIMLYNRHSWRMNKENRLFHFLKKIKKDYTEYIRGIYDMDSKGNAAPITDFSSYMDIRRYFRKFKCFKIELENFDDVDIPYLKVHIPRKKLLDNLAKVLGLDYYIMASK